MNADVWINGHLLGNHPYGYTSFYYDLTKYLNPAGRGNVIAVRVDNTGKNSRWYSGSGIYRHVWLTQLNPVHAKIWGNYITIPKVSKAKAKVDISTSVENNTPANKAVMVKVDLVDPEGHVAGSHTESISINPSVTKEVKQSITINNPRLWDLEHPGLYHARVTISSAGRTIDQTLTTVGIRRLTFDSEKDSF